jgi:hypothetical protein
MYYSNFLKKKDIPDPKSSPEHLHHLSQALVPSLLQPHLRWDIEVCFVPRTKPEGVSLSLVVDTIELLT